MPHRCYFQVEGNLQTSSLESTNQSENPQPRLLLEVSEIPAREDDDESEDPFEEESDDFATLSMNREDDYDEENEGSHEEFRIIGNKPKLRNKTRLYD